MQKKNGIPVELQGLRRRLGLTQTDGESPGLLGPFLGSI